MAPGVPVPSDQLNPVSVADILLPNWSSPVAAYCWVPFKATVALPGVTPRLDSVGLTVTDARIDHGALRVGLTGLGRALVRFYSAREPVVRDGGQPVSPTWDRSTGIGRILIRRDRGVEELMIR